jgi:hypothetical protein
VPSPAEIIRSCLHDQGLITIPDLDGNLPYVQEPKDGSTVCFVSKIADQPDQIVVIADTAGRIFGRSMETGRMMTHYGLMVTVRALTFETGWNLGMAIYAGLGTITRKTTTINNVQYAVANLIRASTLIYVGEEIGRKRELFTIQARVAFQYTQTGLPE